MPISTRVYQLDAESPDEGAIDLASRTILAGGLVAFPTETVYGLGANALNEAAVAKIFAAKGRPPTDPLIAHIAETDQLPQVATNLPDIAKDFADGFWPGPLTLVLEKSARVPRNMTAGLDSVAVRMPNHPVALALLRAAAVPIAAPSANLFSRPSPTSAQHVMDDLAGRVNVVLDAGNTPIGVESTIISLLHAPPRVLRPGGLPLEALRRVMPDIRYKPRFLAEEVAASSPGSLLRHYSPKARVLLFSGADEARVFAAMRAEITRRECVGVIVSDADARQFAGMDVALEGLGADSDQAAVRLFAALRALDKQGVDFILARAPDKTGLGLALWDRLLRASVGSLIEV